MNPRLKVTKANYSGFASTVEANPLLHLDDARRMLMFLFREYPGLLKDKSLVDKIVSSLPNLMKIINETYSIVDSVEKRLAIFSKHGLNRNFQPIEKSKTVKAPLKVMQVDLSNVTIAMKQIEKDPVNYSNDLLEAIFLIKEQFSSTYVDLICQEYPNSFKYIKSVVIDQELAKEDELTPAAILSLYLSPSAQPRKPKRGKIDLLLTQLHGKKLNEAQVLSVTREAAERGLSLSSHLNKPKHAYLGQTVIERFYNYSKLINDRFRGIPSCPICQESSQFISIDKGYAIGCKLHQDKLRRLTSIVDGELITFKDYYRKVWKFTNLHSSQVPEIELRGVNYHLDHQFSIIEGFKQGVLPSLIGHRVNLRVISARDNLQKGSSCSIELSTLYQKLGSINQAGDQHQGLTIQSQCDHQVQETQRRSDHTICAVV